MKNENVNKNQMPKSGYYRKEKHTTDLDAQHVSLQSEAVVQNSNDAYMSIVDIPIYDNPTFKECAIIEECNSIIESSLPIENDASIHNEKLEKFSWDEIKRI